jgi:hypothetical protein
MRYRIQDQSKWFKSLKFAQARALELHQRSGKTVNVVDESGAVVWSTPKVVSSAEKSNELEIAAPPQGDLF